MNNKDESPRVDDCDLRGRIADMANESVARGEPTAWFESLYQSAAGDAAGVPWADLQPSALLVPWMERALPEQTMNERHGRNAIVIGCGLGDDAEYLAGLGWTVTAFDISPTAIAWCKQRFPDSTVDYCVGDLFEFPKAWLEAFDLIFEVYTLQALPVGMREQGIQQLLSMLKRGGHLVLATRIRDEIAPPDGPPWPLHPSELSAISESQAFKTVAEETYQTDDEALTPHVWRMVIARQ